GLEIAADRGFSGQLSLDTAGADYLQTRLPLGLELRLDEFAITFLTGKVQESTIGGTLLIPRVKRQNAPDATPAAPLKMTASLTDVDASGAELDHAIFRFSLATEPEEPLRIGDFPLKLTALAFEFQNGKLSGFAGAGELQLPGIKRNEADRETAWIPFTLGYLDNFFFLEVTAVSGLTIGKDTKLDLQQFRLRFNAEELAQFTIAASLEIKGVEEKNSATPRSIAVFIDYDDTEKTFLARAEGEQPIKIGSFAGVISAISFGTRNGHFDQFGFAAGLEINELTDADGQKVRLNFAVLQTSERFNFKLAEFPADSAIRLKSLELSFAAFEFTLAGGKLVPPSDIGGTLVFPPQADEAQTLTFGMELLEDGFALEVGASDLKTISIGQLKLQLTHFALRKTGTEFASDIQGLLKADVFRDKNGDSIENLSFT
ncbi:MAG: hypothetical protein AAFN92_19820, partial [Bacteroidota bacterium]